MRLTYLIGFFLLPLQANAASGNGGVFVLAGHISTRAYVHFIVENDAGQRTGQLLDGTQVAEIPNTLGAYGAEASDDDDTGDPGYERVSFESSRLAAGHYKLKILPTATTAYWLDFTVRNDNMSRTHIASWGYAIAGTTTTYDFDYQPAAASPPLIIKTVTIALLRSSIQTASRQGQLGDAAFVSRLDKLLAKAQSDISSGRDKQAADRLDQFIHRLDSAFKKEPDPNDEDDADDKKNASTVKRFVVKIAHDSLIEDARTLIAGLGERPKK